jgi:hypothetical protein
VDYLGLRNYRFDGEDLHSSRACHRVCKDRYLIGSATTDSMRRHFEECKEACYKYQKKYRADERKKRQQEREQMEACRNYERDVHYRRNDNQDVPETEQEAVDKKWKKMKDSQSVFHRHGEGNEGHSKYVSPDGFEEAVYDKEGKLVTSDENRGTFNHRSPYEGWGIPHVVEDVWPYVKWGNTINDKTPLIDRIHPFIRKIPSKMPSSDSWYPGTGGPKF